MEAVTTNPSQEFYELVTWGVVIGINLIMMAFAYWLADLAHMMQKPSRKWTAYLLAFMCAGIGIWRMVAIVIYFDDFTARLAIPISAAITWFIIGGIGFAAHRYIVAVNGRMLANRENLRLSEAVRSEVVQPLLLGEPVSMSLVKRHIAASAAYNNAHK